MWRRGGDRDRLDAALPMLTDGLDPQTAGPEVVNVAGLLAEAAEQSLDRDLLDRAETLVRAGIGAGHLVGADDTAPVARVAVAHPVRVDR